MSRDDSAVADEGGGDHRPLAPSSRKNVKMVIKCCLRRACSLEGAKYAEFSDVVESYVKVVSRMMRRASLALLHHLTTSLSQGRAIPDLFRENDTYWKNWLLLHDDRFPSSATEPGDDTIVRRDFDTVKSMLGEVYETTEGFVKQAPPCFDQVLAYAAGTFATVVQNNAWVPLVPRLVRLTKSLFNEGCNLKVYDIVKQLRSKNPDYTGWPPEAEQYARNVRERLKLADGMCLYDEYGHTIPFGVILRFNYWMQAELVRINAKRISLSPVIRVSRVHVRFDTKVLKVLAKKMMPDHPAVQRLTTLEAKHAAAKNDGFYDPDSGAHKMLPAPPDRLGRRGAGMTDASWAQAKADHLRSVAQHASEVQRIKTTPEYRARKDNYDTFVAAQKGAAAALFTNVIRVPGWNFDASVHPC